MLSLESLHDKIEGPLLIGKVLIGQKNAETLRGLPQIEVIDMDALQNAASRPQLINNLQELQCNQRNFLPRSDVFRILRNHSETTIEFLKHVVLLTAVDPFPTLRRHYRKTYGHEAPEADTVTVVIRVLGKALKANRMLKFLIITTQLNGIVSDRQKILLASLIFMVH